MLDRPNFTFDAWATAAMADELRDCCVPGRVQEIVQVDDHTFGMEVYAHRTRHYLILSADPQRARVHRVSRKPRRGLLTPTPLLLLLRKWVRGAHLDRVEQVPFERVLTFTFDHPEEGTSYLVAEIMGRHANLLLLDATRRILQAIKVVGPDRNPHRTTRPGDFYQPPPPQAKTSPLAVTEKDLRGWIREAKAQHPVWRILVARIMGISPLLAREITYRSLGDPFLTAGDVPPEGASRLHQVLATFLHMLATSAWEPTVIRQEGQVWAFAPYPLTHLGNPERVESLSRGIELWLEDAGQADPYAGQRERVRRLLEEAKKRVRHRLEAMEQELAHATDAEQWKRMADWLLTYAYTIPPGAKEATLETDTGPLTVPLDPKLTPVENAQVYYRRYQKARRAQKELPARVEDARSQLAFLEQLETDLQLARDASEIGEVEQALIDGGFVRRPRKRVPPPPAKPLTFTTDEGYTVLVGRSARLNDEITFRRAAPDDLWFHARNVPGAHVILRSGGRPVSEETRQKVAALAAYYSAARDNARVDVQVARVRDVRRHPSGRPGQVLLRREEVLSVRPAPWEEGGNGGIMNAGQ
ncbi:MAG: fibronectin/fibrinogen-binding protein [Chloroflexi bacterium]|nr:fibronectin/fibrinogen-binding protein [Chloroflexota bacterium]